MSAADVLLKPEECAMLLVDFQAGLGFGVESASRQVVVNNAVPCREPSLLFSATGPARKRMKPLVPSSWQMAEGME
jgi:hypothetical protein